MNQNTKVQISDEEKKARREKADKLLQEYSKKNRQDGFSADSIILPFEDTTRAAILSEKNWKIAERLCAEGILSEKNMEIAATLYTSPLEKTLEAFRRGEIDKNELQAAIRRFLGAAIMKKEAS